MNIDKIKNYNQKVLAVLGTVVVLIAIVGLVMITVVLIQEISISNRYNDGILSDEKVEELQKENKRKQLISYDTPRLVDTLNQVYIIPVSHKTLKSAETIHEALDLVGSVSDNETDTRYSNHYYGDFNNLLIYDYKNQKINKLFTDRVNFQNIRTEYFKDDILVLFNASTEDTYKDGVINDLDYQSLFIYSLKAKKLKQIKHENADVMHIDFVGSSKDLIISFGVDHNKDGKFDVYTEPSLIKKYDYAKGELTDIVSKKINAQLQKQLDGRD